MRGILINPESQIIEEVDFNGNYKHINELIGADLFTVVTIQHYPDGGSETIYIDDEGLLHDDPKPLFKWQEYHQPLAGKALILGTDSEGESIATLMELDYVKSQVTYPKVEFVGFQEIPEHEEEHFGQKFWVIGNRPIFKDKS